MSVPSPFHAISKFWTSTLNKFFTSFSFSRLFCLHFKVATCCLAIYLLFSYSLSSWCLQSVEVRMMTTTTIEKEEEESVLAVSRQLHKHVMAHTMLCPNTEHMDEGDKHERIDCTIRVFSLTFCWTRRPVLLGVGSMSM